MRILRKWVENRLELSSKGSQPDKLWNSGGYKRSEGWERGGKETNAMCYGKTMDTSGAGKDWKRLKFGGEKAVDKRGKRGS